MSFSFHAGGRIGDNVERVLYVREFLCFPILMDLSWLFLRWNTTCKARVSGQKPCSDHVVVIRSGNGQLVETVLKRMAMHWMLKLVLP